LTASGGACQWEDLYREFQAEGIASMRFFCMVDPGIAQGPDLTERMIAAIPSLRFHNGDLWMSNANWGERLTRRGVDDLYSVAQEPVPAATWQQFGDVGTEVARAGIQAWLHTQTEYTIDGTIEQLERIDRAVSLKPLRWGLMHMEQVTVPQLERLRALNVFIAVHPREIVTGGLLHRVWGDRAFGMPPLREIQDSGIQWGLGTDAFEVNQYRPFQTLHWAVTGKMVGGRVVNTHPVTREEALIAHTRSNAYAFFRENDLGSIQAGHLADLVVLNRDYLTVPADEIKDIEPVMTMVGGRVVYEAR
jgi:predicted amidohydrolase YtcJ